MVSLAVTSEVATKTDIATLKRETSNVKSELKIEIAELRTEISDLKSELKTEISEMRGELKTDIETMRTDLAKQHTQMIAWVVSAIAVVAAAVKGIEFLFNL